MNLELLLLQFLKAHREGNFSFYIESLSKILPWMFALDHIYYSRWLTIHLKNLNDLPDVCPSAYNAFSDGQFVTQKSTHKFSKILHDQSHEQQNAVVKGEGV